MRALKYTAVYRTIIAFFQSFQPQPPARLGLHPKGAELVLCEPNTAAREAAVAKIVRERGMTSVSPYNDYDVMAGQGTLALELIEQVWWPGGKLSRW